MLHGKRQLTMVLNTENHFQESLSESPQINKQKLDLFISKLGFEEYNDKKKKKKKGTHPSKCLVTLKACWVYFIIFVFQVWDAWYEYKYSFSNMQKSCVLLIKSFKTKSEAGGGTRAWVLAFQESPQNEGILKATSSSTACFPFSTTRRHHWPAVSS